MADNAVQMGQPSGIKSTDVEQTNDYHPHIHLNMYMTCLKVICAASRDPTTVADLTIGSWRGLKQHHSANVALDINFSLLRIVQL